MAGPGAAIHVFGHGTQDVDGRHKGGHDDVARPANNARPAIGSRAMKNAMTRLRRAPATVSFPFRLRLG
jgi:hypothetical protein